MGSYLFVLQENVYSARHNHLLCQKVSLNKLYHRKYYLYLDFVNFARCGGCRLTKNALVSKTNSPIIVKSILH